MRALVTIATLMALAGCAGASEGSDDEESLGGMGVPQQLHGEEYPGPRTEQTVRVHLAPARAANFQPAFLDAVRGAVLAWEEVVPVRFDVAADSADAEVRFGWRVQFEIDRTGQTDLVWDTAGHIEGGVVTLATFDPDGQPMGPEEIRLVALHEIGHLLGLDHSPDSGDVMFPVATVGRLSRRDIETARLLYRLAPGSIR